MLMLSTNISKPTFLHIQPFEFHIKLEHRPVLKTKRGCFVMTSKEMHRWCIIEQSWCYAGQVVQLVWRWWPISDKEEHKTVWYKIAFIQFHLDVVLCQIKFKRVFLRSLIPLNLFKTGHRPLSLNEQKIPWANETQQNITMQTASRCEYYKKEHLETIYATAFEINSTFSKSSNYFWGYCEERGLLRIPMPHAKPCSHGQRRSSCFLGLKIKGAL